MGPIGKISKNYETLVTKENFYVHEQMHFKNILCKTRAKSKNQKAKTKPDDVEVSHD